MAALRLSQMVPLLALLSLTPAVALILPIQPTAPTPVVQQVVATDAILSAPQPATAAASSIFPATTALAANDDDVDEMFGLKPTTKKVDLSAALKGMPTIDTSEIEKNLPGLSEKLSKEIAPQLQKGLDVTIAGSESLLKEATPVIKQFADDSAPKLKTAAESALEGLKPLLARGFTEAQGGLSKVAGEVGTIAEKEGGTLAEQLKAQILTLEKDLEREATSAPSKLEGKVPLEVKTTLKQAAPLLDNLNREVGPKLKEVVQETQKDLEPVLKQTIDDVTPTIKSAASSAISQLVPALQATIDSAWSAISASAGTQVESASPVLKDAATVALLVATPVVLFKLVQLVRALLLPALAAFVIFVGLGVSSDLSTQFPDLGSPVQVFVNLSGLTVVGVGAAVVFSKIASLFASVGNAASGGNKKGAKGKKLPKKARR